MLASDDARAGLGPLHALARPGSALQDRHPAVYGKIAPCHSQDHKQGFIKSRCFLVNIHSLLLHGLSGHCMHCILMQMMRQLIKHGSAAVEVSVALNLNVKMVTSSPWTNSIDSIITTIPNVQHPCFKGLSTITLPDLNLCGLQFLTGLTSLDLSWVWAHDLNQALDLSPLTSLSGLEDVCLDLRGMSFKPLVLNGNFGTLTSRTNLCFSCDWGSQNGYQEPPFDCCVMEAVKKSVSNLTYYEAMDAQYAGRLLLSPSLTTLSEIELDAIETRQQTSGRVFGIP